MWGGNVFGPYFVAVTGKGSDGIGIHGTVGPKTDSLWSIISPCSHGCIRLSNVNIITLHDLLPFAEGTPVEIQDESSK